MPDDTFDQESARRIFPWIANLPADERFEVFRDLIASIVTSHNLGATTERTTELLLIELHSWKSTAEVHANPELLKELTSEFKGEDFGEVPRPRNGSRPAGYILDEAVDLPPQKPELPVRAPRKLCTSHVPNDHAKAPGRSHWCHLATGHPGLHRDLSGRTWETADQSDWTVTEISEHAERGLRTFLSRTGEIGTGIPQQRSGDHE